MALKPVKPKAYVKHFTIRVGPIQTAGAMIPVRKGKPKSDFKLCTPDGQAVKQMYQSADGETWEYYQLGRAVENEHGQLVPVDQEAIAAAKKSDLPSNILNVTVHNANEVSDSLFPSNDNAYVFEPDSDDPANVEWYEVLRSLIDKGDKAYVGVAKFHGHEGFFRLVTWRDRIVMQRQLFPEHLHAHEQYQSGVKVKAALAKKAQKVMDKLCVDFDPDGYVDVNTKRILELSEKAIDGTLDSAEFVKASAAPSAVDVDSVLDSFLD